MNEPGAAVVHSLELNRIQIKRNTSGYEFRLYLVYVLIVFSFREVVNRPLNRLIDFLVIALN